MCTQLMSVKALPGLCSELATVLLANERKQFGMFAQLVLSESFGSIE